MQYRKLLVLCLITLPILVQPSTRLSSPQQLSKVTAHVTGAPDTTTVTARLYFPKSPNQSQQAAQRGTKFFLAYADKAGTVEFPNLVPGFYLLEVYAGQSLIYQKELDVPLNGPVQVTLPAVVEANITLQEYHRAVLRGPEFSGAVAVYVDDVHLQKPITLVVFKTDATTNRWNDNSRFHINELRRIVPENQVLFDKAIEPGKVSVWFYYNGVKYLITGDTTHSDKTHDYSIHFDVQR